jgi:hypothetical protein
VRDPTGEKVALRLATPADAPLLSNLLELYAHDLSGIFPIELGTDGRFEYEKLPRISMSLSSLCYAAIGAPELASRLLIYFGTGFLGNGSFGSLRATVVV